MEYRGYDSAGVAVFNGENIDIVKTQSRLQGLRELTANKENVLGTLGIGQTRWATHGEPTVANAHPHFNKDKFVAVVRSGISENYQSPREKMISRGYGFLSETES